jgi:hypothetical protein
MAKFKDMRKFVTLTQNLRENEGDIFESPDADFTWPHRDDLIKEFSNKHEVSARHAREVYQDCLGFRYIEVSELSRAGESPSIVVTSRGRHFLLGLGILRDFARDNKEWLNPAIAFIVGILAAGVPFIIYLLSQGKTH